MRLASRSIHSLAIAVTMASCAVVPPLTPGSGPGTPGTKPGASAEPKGGEPRPGEPKPGAPTPAGTGAAPQPRGLVNGLVRGVDGAPAAGVAVRGFLIGLDGGSLIGQDGGSLAGNAGNTLVGNSGNTLVGNSGNTYRLAAESLTATTDAQGRFTLPRPLVGTRMNVEAVQAADVKAIRLRLAPDDGEVELALAPTGEIGGRVAAPDDKAVTDFEGVEVFVPGTSYAARAAKDGSYVMTGVPVGTFEVVATKPGLGRGALPAVAVASKRRTAAPTLALARQAAVIAAMEPPAPGAGARVTLRGTGFGASTGATWQVTAGGVVVTGAERVDDQTIVFTMPASARDGEIVVTVAGVPSYGVPFAAVARLTITGAPGAVPAGATAKLGFEALADDDRRLTAAQVAWAVDGDAVAVGPDGTLTARKPGVATVKARAGEATDAVRVRVVEAGSPLVVRWADRAALGIEDLPGKSSLNALAPDPAGGVFAHTGGGEIRHLVGSPAKVTVVLGADATPIDEIGALATAADGTLYAMDATTGRLCLVARDGAVTVVVGPGYDAPDGETFQEGLAPQVRFDTPTGMAVLGNGIYVSADPDGDLRKVDLANAFTVLLLQKGTATQPRVPNDLEFYHPTALAPDLATGDLLLLDHGRIMRNPPDAYLVERIAGKPVLDPAATAHADGPGDVATFGPYGALAARGNHVVVADTQRGRIRLVTLGADGRAVVTTLAGGGKEAVGAGPYHGPDMQLGEVRGIAFDGDRTVVFDDGLDALWRITF